MNYPAAPTLRLYFTPLQFILQSPDTGISAQLILERSTGRCYCTENFNPFENGVNENDLYYLDIFSILGIIVIDSILYLGVITDANIIGSIHKSNIYEIKGAEMIPFVYNTWEPESQIFEKENISKLFTSGFYFSYYYDLTKSLQDSKSDGDLHTRANKSFYWNLELYRDLIIQGVDTQWLIPIIQGFVSIQETCVEEFSIILALVSRRSCDRTGTRYNCRGVDDDGNVANFVETEQIVITNNKNFSYLQIRGSVPIYWEQTGITAQVALSKSNDQSSLAYKKHVSALLHKYSHVTMINLLQDGKYYEKLLTSEWESIIKHSRKEFSSKIVYQYYDFHANCKGKRYQAIQELIKGLEDYFNYYSFYSENSVKVEHKQKGVIRTNCLDCLDRTNVVQGYIAWSVLRSMLKTLQIDLTLSLNQPSNAPILQVFKNMWADNGDLLSFQYTGTGSTISSITRGEKQGLITMISQSLKSIGRFYNANLNDAAKQKSIEAVLRRRDSSQYNRIDTEVFNRESEYTQYKFYKIRCISWNIGGNKLYDCNLQKLIVGNEFSDIIVFAFQEVVKLSPNNVIREKNNVKRIALLKNLISNVLTFDKYSLVCESSLVGVVLFVYSKVSVSNYITKIEFDTMRLGFGGKMGNKGAVVVRFNLEDSTVCVIACHLASGISKNELRKSQIREILSEIFVKEKFDHRQMQIFEHDYKILCGDLNFRIDLPNDIIKDLITEKNYKELLISDQLSQNFAHGGLSGYKEFLINFSPTYKFDKNSCSYDTSKKQRAPAWCDRILYNGDFNVLAYDSVDLRNSDHRPIFAEMIIKSKRFDLNRKLEITEFLTKELENKELNA